MQFLVPVMGCLFKVLHSFSSGGLETDREALLLPALPIREKEEEKSKKKSEMEPLLPTCMG